LGGGVGEEEGRKEEEENKEDKEKREGGQSPLGKTAKANEKKKKEKKFLLGRRSMISKWKEKDLSLSLSISPTIRRPSPPTYRDVLTGPTSAKSWASISSVMP